MSAHGHESNREFETALARALSQKLRPSGKYCPSPETVATYFEGSLTSDEAERCELHFSTCAGCQHEIGALVRMEISGGRPEDDLLGEPNWTRTRTAALAGALLIAGLGIVITIRFLPAGKLPGHASPTPSLIVEPAIDLPPVSAATASPTEGRPSEAEAAPEPSPELLSEQSVATVTPPEEPSPLPSLTATVQAVSEKPLPHPTPSRGPALPPEPVAMARTPARKRDRILPPNAPPTPGLRPPTATVSVYSPSPSPTSTPSPSSTPKEVKVLAPTPLPSPKLPQQSSGALAAFGRLLSGQAFPPQSARRMVIVLAPGKSSISWRIGSGGQIGRSRDFGRTWKMLASGVDVDLLAGAASSETVCWLVGRSGVILKTTDGEQWKRIRSPTTRDLLRIIAKSAMAVSVVAEGGETFVTSDGGRSWERK